MHKYIEIIHPGSWHHHLKKRTLHIPLNMLLAGFVFHSLVIDESFTMQNSFFVCNYVTRTKPRVHRKTYINHWLSLICIMLSRRCHKNAYPFTRARSLNEVAIAYREMAPLTQSVIEQMLLFNESHPVVDYIPYHEQEYYIAFEKVLQKFIYND